MLLAQEVATLDLLAEGRLEFGIGAGWLAADYQAAGIPFAPGGHPRAAPGRSGVGAETALRRWTSHL